MTTDLESLRIDRPPEASSPRRSSRGWRILCLLLLLLLVGSLVLPSRWRPWSKRAEEERVAVRVERIALGGSGSTGSGGAFSASGWVKLPLHYPVVVTPLDEGRIDEVTVVEGDVVAKGQVIARLYEGDLRAELDAASARVREAVAAVEKHETGSRPQEIGEARAEMVGIEAELAVARDVLAHSRELQPSGAISLEDLQRDEGAVAAGEANLARAGERLALREEGFRAEEVALARASLERARAEEELARLRLGYAEVKSPIDGVVIERRARVGEWIRPSERYLVSLYDPADLEVRVDVNQSDLGRIVPGQEVEISSRAEEEKIHAGVVRFTEPKADLVKNTVAVRVRLSLTGEERLHPDMVVRARFLPASSAPEEGGDAAPPAPSITVPVAAVLRAGAETFLFVVEEGVARRRTIGLGELEAGRRVVREGLQGGELVVIDGASSLRDETPVQIEE